MIIQILFSVLFAFNHSHATPPDVVIDLPKETLALNSPILVSPDGKYILVEGVRKSGGKLSNSIVYFDLQTKVAREITESFYVRKVLVTDDGRHLYLFENSFGPAAIEYLTLDDAGSVIKRQSVRKSGVGDVGVGSIYLAQNNRLFYSDWDSVRDFQQIVYWDPETGKTAELMAEQTAWRPGALSGATRNDPYAGKNPWILVYTAHCPSNKSCIDGKVTAINVNNLEKRDLDIPDKTFVGYLTEISMDERSDQPWASVGRCMGPQGAVASIYHVLTDEQITLFNVPEINYCTTDRSDRLFSIRGNMILRKWGTQTRIYDLQKKVLWDMPFVWLSDDGQRAQVHGLQDNFSQFDLAHGTSKYGFYYPTNNRFWLFKDVTTFGDDEPSAIDFVTIDGGYARAISWNERVETKTSFTQKIWKLPDVQDGRQPTNIEISGDKSDLSQPGEPCVRDRSAQGIICLTYSKKSKAKFWRL